MKLKVKQKVDQGRGSLSNSVGLINELNIRDDESHPFKVPLIKNILVTKRSNLL